MSRLNDRAFEILCAEVHKCAGNDAVGKVQRDIVLKRFEKLRSSQGSPASLEELRDKIIDIFPKFNEKALKVAARANQPSARSLSKIKWAAGILVGGAGVLWVLNLPSPIIRLSVARTAPILLLPSYISMDYHYRQAIARVEQADQLINHATSPDDLVLGEVKVKEAQQHLNALPVWFLGYSPQYNFWFGWRFTFDEFEVARANVGRMEAKVFQQKNAQVELERGEKALAAAKQQYQKAQTEGDRETAIASWQAAIDRLAQVPPQTLAGETTQTKLAAVKRDFEQVAGLVAGSGRTGTLISAAQQFAIAAEQAAQNSPHTASEWEEIATLWEQASDRLQQVSLDDPGYIEAQKLLAKYQSNLGSARTQLQAEQESVAALEQAKDRIPTLLASKENQNQVTAQLQDIINQLEKVKSGTTAYAQSQQLLESAQNKLKQLQAK